MARAEGADLVTAPWQVTTAAGTGRHPVGIDIGVIVYLLARTELPGRPSTRSNSATALVLRRPAAKGRHPVPDGPGHP